MFEFVAPLPLARIYQVGKRGSSVTVQFEHPIPSVFEAIELSIATVDTPDDVIQVVTVKTSFFGSYDVVVSTFLDFGSAEKD